MKRFVSRLVHDRWFLSVLTIAGACIGSAMLNTCAALAQDISSKVAAKETAFQSLTLLPLDSTRFEVAEEEMTLDAIATNINTQVEINIALSEEVEGLTWDQIPIVRDFIDEDGDVDMSGGSLPISVSVSNFMEAYGVVVSTDFKVP